MEMVSTHAPARGATNELLHARHHVTVSTHAPARGATKRFIPVCEGAKGFNPRTRTGCDGGHGAYIPGMVLVSTHAPARGATILCQPLHSRAYVSTHAPARGATFLCAFLTCRTRGFNPRTRTGCDIRFAKVGNPICRFQPTHPHGVRRISLWIVLQR